MTPPDRPSRRSPALFDPLLRAVGQWRERSALQGRSAAEIFGEYYQRNTWGSADSRSGRGSDLQQTNALRQVLPTLLSELGVKRLLDLPCGDFHWMSQVELGGIEYLGGDIVPEMIESNRLRFERPGVAFQRIDLLHDELPPADLVLCRDVLVHFSVDDIGLALRAIVRSPARWLLTTTFRDRRANDAIVTGQWRPLNLLAPPFNWPWPQQLIEEACTEGDGRYADKCLGLWPVAALREHLAR